MECIKKTESLPNVMEVYYVGGFQERVEHSFDVQPELSKKVKSGEIPELVSHLYTYLLALNPDNSWYFDKDKFLDWLAWVDEPTYEEIDAGLRDLAELGYIKICDNKVILFK